MKVYLKNDIDTTMSGYIPKGYYNVNTVCDEKCADGITRTFYRLDGQTGLIDKRMFHTISELRLLKIKELKYATK